MGIFGSMISKVLNSSGGGNSDSELLNFGQQLLRETASDISEKLDEGINSAKINLENAYKRMKPINENHYPEFKKDEAAFVSKEGILWFIRKDLEAARCYYSGGKEGYIVSERVQGNGAAQVTPMFSKLKEDIVNTEKKVQEIEAAKGYEFVRCESNHIIFREIKTQRELSAEESNEI
jgi:hypothetical protein